MFRLITKFKKKLVLAEHLSDIKHVKTFYSEFLNANEEVEREKLKELRIELEKLSEASQTTKFKDKVEIAQKRFDEQNKFVNGIIKWQTHLKKMYETKKELESYIKNM